MGYYFKHFFLNLDPNIFKSIICFIQIMEGAELVRLNHQRNKSEIVNLVKEMFRLDKWGDEEFKVQLQELVLKDEELVKDVISKIKQEKGLE